jgi:rfaE bifunctional protein kinase chain/domain
MEALANTLRDSFAGKKVAILGDLVADQFLSGTISRVSREAPVFILRHDETETRAGGGANAAVNIASLGGAPLLVGLVGHDINGGLLLDRLSSDQVDTSLVVRSEKVSTITKVRVLAGQHYAARQQVIRIDYENNTPLDEPIRSSLRDNIAQALEIADAAVVSDYGYGAADPSFFADIRKLADARGIPLVVDSRYRIRDFAGATTATPNQEEVENILGPNFSESDCERLRDQLDLRSLLITRGNQGMLLAESGKETLRLDAVGSLDPIDVTGAGDTVIAAYSLGLASGLSFADSACIANHAGSVVVMKKGTASLSIEELIESISASPSDAIAEGAS